MSSHQFDYNTLKLQHMDHLKSGVFVPICQTFQYQSFKFGCVPLNHILYNVQSGDQFIILLQASKSVLTATFKTFKNLLHFEYCVGL